jgi:hypothetical protein
MREEVNPDSTFTMLDNNPTLITEEENTWLCKEIEEAEIIEVIRGLAPDKIMGLDGFSIHFYHAC